jgi:hypothetical protein
MTWLRSIRISSALCVVALAPMFSTNALANSLPLSELQKQIVGKVRKWKAGRTSVSEMSEADKRMMLGVPLSEVPTVANYGKHLGVVENALPEQFDWRNYNGSNYVSPVKNQGRCGSCVAFAVSSTFESQLNVDTNATGLPWSFSPQHIFACGGGACDTGWQTAFAVDFLNTDGAPEEACFPYKSGALGDDMECKSSCSDSKSRSLKAELRVRSAPVVGASVDEVKAALLGGPVASNMKVFEDFYFYKSGVYKHTSGKVVGGHAVMIIGWSNPDQAWIVRNSWGTDWGMNGDFMISWEDKGMLGGTFYGLAPSKTFSALMLEGPAEHSFVRGSVSFKVRTANMVASSATLELRGAEEAIIRRAFDGEGNLIFNTSDIPDGVYTVQARAKTDKGEERISQSHIFYVRNGEVTATLKIERIKKNMNVWDPIVPQFRISSRPVPVAKIRYRLIDSSGTEVLMRSGPHTSDLVGLSFKPASVKIGHYVMIGEAVSDEGKVVASDTTEFNVIEK